MSKIPQPANWAAAYDLEHAPWGDLRFVKNAGVTVATYEYDGLHWRIAKTAGTNVEHYYYNEAAQCLELRSGSETSSAKEATGQFLGLISPHTVAIVS